MDKFSKKEYNLFKKYTQINGTSGDEHLVAKSLIADYKKFGFELIKDNLGSIFAFKKSKDPKFKVLIMAHMDEIGFMVTRILYNGILEGTPIGGPYYDYICGSRCTLTNKYNQEIKGCIYKKTDTKTYGDFIFDFGFDNREEAESIVSLGDRITIDGECLLINNGTRMMSKAIDDRYGIVLGLEVLEYFKNKELPFDLYIGGSVQEEVGLRGAKIISNTINPDIAIILDCSNALDYKNGDGFIGGGVLLRYYDRVMIAFEELIKLQEKAAKKAKAEYQCFQTLGGTDAGAIHMSDDGVLTLTHCIVGRNIHSGITTISAHDYHAAKKSLIQLLKMLDEKTYLKLKEWRH